MKFDIFTRQIKMNKELNELDNLVIDFTRILNTENRPYASLRLENAKHFYNIFDKTIDQNLLKYFLENLDKADTCQTYLV